MRKRTREEIIENMCMTYRHDFGMDKYEFFGGLISTGMTDDERNFLRRQMAQIFDNDIAPYMEFRVDKK
jgi:hypothetical protein